MSFVERSSCPDGHANAAVNVAWTVPSKPGSRLERASALVAFTARDARDYCDRIQSLLGSSVLAMSGLGGALSFGGFRPAVNPLSSCTGGRFSRFVTSLPC